MSSLASTLIAVAGAVAAVLLLWRVFLSGMKFTKRVVHFLDDWQGEEARPGAPRRLGVMERLDQQDERIAKVEERTRQLTPNGGSHMADKVTRIETQLENQDSKTALEALARIEQRLSIQTDMSLINDALSEGPPK
jgi:hypothetical protein